MHTDPNINCIPTTLSRQKTTVLYIQKGIRKAAFNPQVWSGMVWYGVCEWSPCLRSRSSQARRSGWSSISYNRCRFSTLACYNNNNNNSRIRYNNKPYGPNTHTQSSSRQNCDFSSHHIPMGVKQRCGSALWETSWIRIRMEDAEPDSEGKSRRKFAKKILKTMLSGTQPSRKH